MMLWTCKHCGCLYIAACLNSCPHCYTPKGETMPKTSKEYGTSNRYEEAVTESTVEDTTLSEAADAVKKVRKPRKTPVNNPYAPRPGSES